MALFPLALVVLHQVVLFATRKEYTVHESGGIVVTGASSGIGRHAALALAKKGFVVYAGCRKVCASRYVCACKHACEHGRMRHCRALRRSPTWPSCGRKASTRWCLPSHRVAKIGSQGHGQWHCSAASHAAAACQPYSSSCYSSGPLLRRSGST